MKYLSFVSLVDSFLILMSWILLLILGTYVLVLSVTNFILSYPNTEMDKTMIFVFTIRIHIPHNLRNLQWCKHDVFIWLLQVVLWFEKPLWSGIAWSLSFVSSHSSAGSSMSSFYWYSFLHTSWSLYRTSPWDSTRMIHVRSNGPW